MPVAAHDHANTARDRDSANALDVGRGLGSDLADADRVGSAATARSDRDVVAPGSEAVPAESHRNIVAPGAVIEAVHRPVGGIALPVVL